MKAVLATIGHDRPGLVGELAELVASLGLNVDDSRMTVLGGEFAVLMSVKGPNDTLKALESRLAEHCAQAGLAHLFRVTEERSTASGQRAWVNVSTMDHPGIVSQVAGFFARRAINIAELNTKVGAAAHTGTPTFDLDLTIEVPESADLDDIIVGFSAFCDESDLDGSIRTEATDYTER